MNYAQAPILTKREIFAAMAMQPLLAMFGGVAMDPETVEAQVSIAATRVADALLAELEKKK